MHYEVPVGLGGSARFRSTAILGTGKMALWGKGKGAWGGSLGTGAKGTRREKGNMKPMRRFVVPGLFVDDAMRQGAREEGSIGNFSSPSS